MSFTILLVDDDPLEHQAVQRSLRNCRIPVETYFAGDGEQALMMLRGELSGRMDRMLVLLDLNMPMMNGLEFLRALRADYRLFDVRVVVYSSSEYPRDLQATRALGVRDFLVKRTGVPTELLQLIEDHQPIAERA